MITIYERDETDFSANGLGTLNPTSCTVSETMNGGFEVTLIHPIDGAGKFRRIQEERIIKVPVPAGRTPRIAMSAAAQTLRIYEVVTDGQRLYLRAAPSQSAKGLHAYKPGTEVVVIDNTTNSQWSEVETPDGRHGWMWTDNLSYVRTEATGEAVNSIKEAANLREQPFRIYKVVPTLTGVTAYARHVFYDLMDNMISSYKPGDSTTGAAAFIGLSGATEDGHEFTFYSDVDSTAEDVEIIDKNPAEAILDDGGIIENYGGELMRDWWDVYLAKRIGEETGIQIREGKNLLGISYAIDITNAVTRVIPKGEDEDGNPLYLDGRYRENTAEDKPVYANHKYGMIEVKEAKVKTTGDDKRSEQECLELMEKAAIEAFEAGCDLPDVTLNVDFIDCAETEEYRQYKFLQGIHMGDTVKVIARRVGVEVAMRMTQYTYDCLKKKYTKMTLGTIDATIEGNMINPRSIGSGTITGGMIKLGSIGTGQIMDGAVNSLKIALAAIDYAHINEATVGKLSADAVTAIRADIRELVAGNITTDQLYADLAVIAAAQITAANIEKANIQWAQIAELTAEIARIANAEIAKAEIDWAQIKNAQIDAADITNLTVAVATIVHAEIATAEIDWARIKNVEVDTAQIKLGAITQALIAAGAIGTAQIADGSITSAKIVELTADLIKTGTLSADRLLIKGAGGLFYEINAQAGGLTSTQLTEEQYKNAISGTALVAKSVTAAQIAAKTITANEILSGTITAAEIDVANLFAAEATIAALDAYILRTNTIESLKGSLDIWASEKVRLAVDGVQIGGRNLLRNTAELRTANYSFDASGAETMGSYAEDDEGGFHIVCDGANVRWWPGIQPVTPGQSYAMSVRYRMNSGEAPIQFQYAFQNASGDAVDYYDSNRLGTTKSLTEGGWTILQSVFTVPENAAIVRVNLAARTGSDYALYNCDYNIRRPKFERGTKATDWSPAPEDTDETIAEVSAALAVQAGEISAKVNQSEFNALGKRVTSTESAITLHSDQIASKVERTEFDALGNQVSANSSAITQTATQIRSEVASSVSGLQTQIDQTEDQVLILAGRSVGGTNMIRNTGTLKKANYSFDASGASALGSCTEDDEGGFHIVCDNANVRCWMGEYAVSPGQSYAMSARYRMNSGNAPIQFQYVLKSTGGADLYYWDSVNHGTPGTVTEDGWTVLRSVFAVPDNTAVAKVSIALRTGVDGALYTCDYNIRRPKFESGSMPTDWTPSPDDPSNGLDTGSGSGVRVKITPDEFDVDVPGTDGDFTLNRTGARIPVVNSDVVYAQNLAYRYYGAADIYVNAAASGDQIAAGSHYRSLTDALNTLSGKYIPYDVRIHVESDTYGNLSLTGAYGRTVTVNGGGRAVYGRMDIMDNALRTFVSNLTVAGDGTDAAVRLVGEGWSNWNDCTINGSGSGNGIAVYDGAKAMLLGCGLYNATNLLYAGHASDISAIALKGGGGTNFAQLDGCTIKFSGTRPDGTLSVANTPICKPDDPTTLSIDYGTATPTTPTISTASWNYLYSDSYCTGWSYFSDDDVRQGYNGETIYGVIWFDAAAMRSALSGKTINQASLRLHMHNGVGRGVAVSVQLYGTNMDYSGRTGTPGLAAAYGTIGSTTPNEINEITIPTQVITDIVNGTIQALVLKSDDTALYKDRAYSQNYAKFSGSSTATAENCPRLTVVYQ